MSVSTSIRVGHWHIEPALGRISRGGKFRHLEPQVMKVLMYLAERSGQVVTRHELFARLWPNSVVHDMALTRCITQIRKAFDDSRENPRVIETIPKQGYRLTARVKSLKRQSPAEFLRDHWLASTGTAAAMLLFMAAPVTGSLDIPQAGALDMSSIFQDPASVFYDRGREFYDRYNYEDNESAIVMYERAIKESGDFSLAYSGLSNALAMKSYYWNGNTVGRANKAAQKAISLDPLSGEAYNALGLVLALRGETDAAIQSQHQALALKPDYWQAAQNLGALYFKEFGLDKAATWFRRSIELNPDNTTAMRDLGHIRLMLGDLDGAKSWLKSVSDREPLHRGAIRSLADVALVEGHFTDALDRCALLLRSFPGDMPCLQSSAVAAYMAQDYEQSDRFYSLMADNSPGHLYASLGQAQLAAIRGDHDRSNRMLHEIEQTARDNLRDSGPRWNLSWMLAATYAQKGDKDQAAHWLARTLESGRTFYLWDSKDPAFVPLHGHPAFEAYLDTMRSRAAAALRTLPDTRDTESI